MVENLELWTPPLEDLVTMDPSVVQNPRSGSSRGPCCSQQGLDFLADHVQICLLGASSLRQIYLWRPYQGLLPPDNTAPWDMAASPPR